MRFHLIDHIETWEKDSSIRACKLTSRNEELWDITETGAVMPEPLVLEALCQAGAWLIFLSTAGRQRAALLSIGSVSFQGKVYPGDAIALEGQVMAMGEEVASLSGQASVAGRTVLAAEEILCTLIAPSELEDPAETLRMQHLLTRGGGA